MCSEFLFPSENNGENSAQGRQDRVPNTDVNVVHDEPPSAADERETPSPVPSRAPSVFLPEKPERKPRTASAKSAAEGIPQTGPALSPDDPASPSRCGALFRTGRMPRTFFTKPTDGSEAFFFRKNEIIISCWNPPFAEHYKPKHPDSRKIVTVSCRTLRTYQSAEARRPAETE